MSQSIASAQLLPDGQPRFRIPAHPGNADWEAAAEAEAAGGVEADVRIFLDAQCGEGDVLLDLEPGFGFVALGAATAVHGMPTVLVYGLESNVALSLQDAAANAGSWLESLGNERRAHLAADVADRLGAEGRIFVHCRAADVPGVCTALLPHREADRLLSICIMDAHYSETWPSAMQALAEIGFAPAELAEQRNNAVLLPVRGAPQSAVIALPADLLS